MPPPYTATLVAAHRAHPQGGRLFSYIRFLPLHPVQGSHVLVTSKKGPQMPFLHSFTDISGSFFICPEFVSLSD